MPLIKRLLHRLGLVRQRLGGNDTITTEALRERINECFAEYDAEIWALQRQVRQLQSLINVLVANDHRVAEQINNLWSSRAKDVNAINSLNDEVTAEILQLKKVALPGKSKGRWSMTG